MIRIFNKQYGYYLPAFLYISIDEDIDFNNFEDNSNEVKGTFIHEYCHYLQDVSTTYGYLNFINGFQNYLSKININDDDSETERILYHNYRFSNLYRGDDDIEGYKGCLTSINKICFKEDKYIKAKYPDEDCRYVAVTCNGSMEFKFGNYCIMESMAYLVEKRLYGTGETIDDFPYKVCEMICKKEYAEFAQNEIYVMALCELALLEVAGAKFFIEALRMMKEKKFIPQSVFELEEFVDKHFKIGFRGDKKRILEILQEVYLDGIVDFEHIRGWIVSRYSIGCEYREKSKCFISLILSTEEKERFDLWNRMMKDFGCPNVINKNGHLSNGAYLNNEEVDIGYMLAPMAINNLLNATRNKIQPCALAEICKAFTTKSSYDELCELNPRKKADEQWLCPLGVFLNLYHLE